MTLLCRQGFADRDLGPRNQGTAPKPAELEALVDATFKGFVPDDQRELLIKGLRALVRLAE